MSDERFNPETAKDWNREPGIVIVPGSNYSNEMQRFEQFPSRYGSSPGNPYHYRPFPKMVYKADLWKGKPLCLAAAPDPNEFPNPNDFHRVSEMAFRFNEKCQRTVNDEQELQKALEMGYRENPSEAVAWLESKQRGEANAAAERNYADRNMGDAAKVEAAEAVREAFTEEGKHLASVPEKPRTKRKYTRRAKPDAA